MVVTNGRTLTETFDGDIGRLDVPVMRAIRETMATIDGLVDTAAFDSVLDPTLVAVRFGDGIGDADWCRFDIRWYRTGCYNVHHVDESGRDFRFDNHPKTGVPDRHFHPPPDARSAAAEPSCITVEDHELVVRAVHKLWRRAYDSGDCSKLNTAQNPP